MDWREIGLISFTTIFVQNFVLTKTLGICPQLNNSKDIPTAVISGCVLTANLVFLTFVAWTFANLFVFGGELNLISSKGLGKIEAQLILLLFFLILVVSVSEVSETFLQSFYPGLYRKIGVFRYFVSTNCLVLGLLLMLVSVFESYIFQQSLLKSLVYAFSAGLGFTLVQLIFAGLSERLMFCNVPEAFRGTPIKLITLGLMAMSFFGLIGINF
ncbi:hypothetical protein IT568_04675 [bacterium]|nr:hypothetical protein [bacterium]